MSEKLNYNEALRALHLIIADVRDPYLQNRFNDWVNENLHKVSVTHSSSKEAELMASSEFAEYYIKATLRQKLMHEASTIAVDRVEEYAGYPRAKVRELSMVIVGKKV